MMKNGMLLIISMQGGNGDWDGGEVVDWLIYPFHFFAGGNGRLCGMG